MKTEGPGPGWLNNPSRGWTRMDCATTGPTWKGAAKTGWGNAWDFNRCRANSRQLRQPMHLSGYREPPL